MKSLTYEQRLHKLGWAKLYEPREHGDLILTYQTINNNP